MADEPVWNDESRNELRETLRNAILGDLRLAKLDREQILQNCDEVYIQEESPEPERESLLQYAADELSRIAAQLESEAATWPEETDCDRLDRVESDLRDRGILLWQASPCCDTCTHSEISDRIDVIDDRDPGFANRVRGYSFFIDQNLPEYLAENTKLSVYLGYGWISPDDSEVAQEVYQSNALAIGREVCECLKVNNIKLDWDGKLSQKIRVSLNWQRRTMLQ
ncbi:DUF6891 domain-containing protein [Singulisphaera rosea]